MELEQIIGVVVIRCKCGAKFVVNTTAVEEGVLVVCDKDIGGCGCTYNIPRWSKLHMTLEPTQLSKWSRECKEIMKEYNKPYTNNYAVPLAVYKSMLADWVINGKKPRVPAKHKKVIQFPELNEEQLQSTVDTLVSLGFKRADALARVEIALEQGFRHENDILKAIMTL
jgi:hypothetical protein